MSDANQCVAVGVAGWSYPDWQGYVYDETVRDPLAFLVQYVDVIEINSTFYRPAIAKQAESWLRRTESKPDFFFTAKLSREITHEGKRDTTHMRGFLDGLKPLLDAGKLPMILAQFRYDFRDEAESRAHLAWIVETVATQTGVVFELRHRSWQSDEAMEFLGRLGASVAHLDYPTGRESFDLDVVPVGSAGYLRLHGRNAQAWFDPRAGRDETYNYYYSRPERDRIVDRARRIQKHFRSLTVVANNHYQGKEVANALQIKAAIADARVPVPPKLLERYEELREIADDESLRRWRESRAGELF